MERTYIIPLRKEWLKAPMYGRTKKAVKATKEFLMKHMKVKTVKLGRHLNMKLFEKGYRHPPHKVEVSVELIKDKEGDYAYAELVGITKEVLKTVKVEKKEGLAGKIDALRNKGNNKIDAKAEGIKEEEKIIREKPLRTEKKAEVSADKVNAKAEASKLHEKTFITRTGK